MEAKNFENVCPGCGNDDPNFIKIEPAPFYSGGLIVAGIFFLICAFKSDGLIQMMYGAVVFGIVVYYENQEKKYKDRYQRHCLKCGQITFFYRNPNFNANVENTQPIQQPVQPPVQQPVRQPIGNSTDAFRADLITLHQEFVKDALKTMENISKKIYEKIYLYNPAIKNKPKEMPEVFNEIRDDINNFFFHGTQKIISENFPQKYSISYINSHENIAKMLKDSSIVANTVENILVEYIEICSSFLRNDLIEYVNREYNVKLALNERNAVIDVGKIEKLKSEIDLDSIADKIILEMMQEKSTQERPTQEKSTRKRTNKAHSTINSDNENRKNNTSNEEDFNSMYLNAVRKNYSDNTDIERFLNYGGLDKLRETLFDSEKIILVSNAHESLYSEKSSLAKNMLSDDIVVLTNKRMLYLRKKLFGTLVDDIALRQFSKIIFEENVLKFGDLEIYVQKMKSLKERVYDMMI